VNDLTATSVVLFAFVAKLVRTV